MHIYPQGNKNIKGAKRRSSEGQAPAAASIDDVAAEAGATEASESNQQLQEPSRFLATELSHHYLLQSLYMLHSSPSIKR